jgi:hypothetical protein
MFYGITKYEIRYDPNLSPSSYSVNKHSRQRDRLTSTVGSDLLLSWWILSHGQPSAPGDRRGVSVEQ